MSKTVFITLPFWMIIWLHFQFWSKVVLLWAFEDTSVFSRAPRVSRGFWGQPAAPEFNLITLIRIIFALGIFVFSDSFKYHFDRSRFLSKNGLFMFSKIICNRTLWDLLIWGPKCFPFSGKLLAIILTNSITLPFYLLSPRLPTRNFGFFQCLF